ncbi:MAG: hypothetical protein V7641_286 [Blastocatellia bacterium]
MRLDVVQIVDALPRPDEGHKHAMTMAPVDMAKGLSQLIKPLGRNSRKIALVSNNDDKSYAAYMDAQYETHKMSGDLATQTMRFVQDTVKRLKGNLPKNMVLVTDDPKLVMLCDSLPPDVNLKVWANSATAPPELTEMDHCFQPLEDMLPNLKIAQIDVRIDLENIFIGLVKRGWRPNMHELMAAIRQGIEKKCPGGHIVSTTGYADFDALNRHHGGPTINWQRELTMAGGDSRYVINQHGKNTADMKIADDIRTVVEHDSNTGAIDVIGLVTMDRDFRHVVERVKSRGKKAIVLGLQDGLSRELENIASDVCHLDDYLKIPKAGHKAAPPSVPPRREDTALMMKIGAWMNQNRFGYVYRDKLEQEFSKEAEGLHKLIADGWFTAARNSSFDSQGQPRALEPNPEHPTACAARYLAGWITSRLDYCLNQKGMPYVDGNFLANGMARERKLVENGVGQTRADAESWLHTAAAAGLVVAQEQEHPQTPGKYITIWRLPEQTAQTETAPAVEDDSNAPQSEPVLDFRKTASQPELNHLRKLLTYGLNDNDLNCLLLDYFVEVYRKCEGSSKSVKVQAALEYVERHNAYNKLLEAIKNQSPGLFEQPEEELRKAA